MKEHMKSLLQALLIFNVLLLVKLSAGLQHCKSIKILRDILSTQELELVFSLSFPRTLH